MTITPSDRAARLSQFLHPAPHAESRNNAKDGSLPSEDFPMQSWRLYSSWRRWTLLTVLFLVTTSNYFDYFIISVLLEPIKAEFRVSDTELGLLGGFCFAILYAVTALPIARWSDRGNRKTVITVSLACWSVMTALCGMAHSFWQLAVARMGVGMVEPGALPPAQSLVADYFPPERRATALAVLTQGGSAFGWLVGIGIGGYMVARHGWRATILFAGLPGLVFVAVAGFVLDEPRNRLGFPRSEKDSASSWQMVLHLKRKTTYIFALVGLSLFAIFSYGVAIFLPAFMTRSLGADMSAVSFTWGLSISAANLLGALAGGALADRLGCQDVRWYLRLPAIACILGAPAYALALCTTSLRTFIPCDALAEFILAAGMPPVFVAIQDISGRQRRTMAAALGLLLFALVGSGVGPPLVGVISDFLASEYGTESLRYSLIAIVAFLLPGAAAFYVSARGMLKDLEY